MARSMPEAPKTWILTGSPVSDADAALLLDRMRAAAGTPA
jgi:hypothetical protein